jgi:hypothetical protein
VTVSIVQISQMKTKVVTSGNPVNNMCDLCHSSPCLNGCPNKTVVPVLRCDECKHGLYSGDKYMEYDGDTICKRCYNEWDTEDWLDFLHVKERQL